MPYPAVTDNIIIRNISVQARTVPSLQIAFDWHRDSKGYDIVDGRWPINARRSQNSPLRTVGVALPEKLGISGGKVAPQCIVRRGGELKRYAPLQKFHNLFEQFARDVVSPDSLLRFIEKFGPLTRYGLDRQFGEDVGLLLANAKAMNMVLSGYYRGRRDLYEAVGPAGMPLGEIGVTLTIDPTSKAAALRLSLGIKDLVTALWVQLGQSLSAGTSMRQCQFCQSLFAAGPGSGRRGDARFCSDEHRIVYNSHRRTSVER